MINLFKKLASRGMAGISDFIIIATLGLIVWFLLMSDSEYRYIKASISCVGFVLAYAVYWLANKFDDGI
ncbi:hypothetical protein [Hafnia psychrotolerans]|uniref:Uncharacterized protein n=1 Tax=Hafnia psychrotolerans TaxID=1477018 RepID=A0ABQ1GC95_9GAMM|nr:hypothetical protein [Hafnia psychrotolerans]GGA40998.1 hypothetical protein GCM10011328_14930 [Hafnia psychrotolerans]